MAITQVQSKGYFASAAATTHNITLDQEPAEGNRLVLLVQDDNTGTITASGWASQVSVIDAFNGLAVLDRLAPASFGTTVTFTLGTSGLAVAFVVELAGSVGTPTRDQVGSTTTDDGGTGTSGTTTAADEFLIGAVGDHNNGDKGGLAGTNFSAWSNSSTEVFDGGCQTGGANPYIGVATRTVSATGTYSTTPTGGSNSGVIATYLEVAAGTLSHDTQTRFPATDGTSTATGDQTFSHAGGAAADGAVVEVYGTGTAAHVTGVLYGGTAMTLVEEATDTTEAGRVSIYVLHGLQALGLGGTQTVTLQGATAVAKWALCSTVLVEGAGWTTQGVGNNHVNTTTSTNPTVTVTTSATSLLYGGVHGGAAAPTSYAVGSGYTLAEDQDYGALSARSQRRTSPVAAGGVVFNFTFGTSDDWCIAAVAIGALAPAAPAARPPMFASQYAGRW